MNFPTLSTERLLLRQLNADDAKRTFEQFADDAVTRFYDLPTMTELAQAENLIALHNQRFEQSVGIRWAICLETQPDRVLGSAGLVWKAVNHSAILGYDLHPDSWGHGYASEAVRAIIDVAFNELPPFHLNRIEALTYLDNRASIKLLERIGFQQEGILRQWGFWKGEYHDMRCFSLLRSDLKPDVSP